ncbi:hypothetical protein DFH11DRAFT_11151 [Phellopilus nigrolimitatus]|nr:hypothetical protein DFH11DRAFT_11151 [Phellopilus nigrolimitatus]
MFASMDDLLFQISQISTELHRHAAPQECDVAIVEKDAGPSAFLDAFPSINLSVPEPLAMVFALTSEGASIEVARELSAIHSQRCAELADHYAGIYRNMCQRIAPTLRGRSSKKQLETYARLQKIRRLYVQTVASWSENLVQTAGSQFANAKSNDVGRRSSQQFNTNFLPVLEKCFDENPFPSRAVKLSLAKTSGMSVRQIGVWFQNHRTRTKKIALKTRSIDATLYDAKDYHDLTDMAEKNTDSSESEETALDTENESDANHGSKSSRSSSFTAVNEDSDALAWQTPSYAYPTSYPPDLEGREDPFSCRFGVFTFAKPEWRRRASTANIALVCDEPDVSAMVDAFGRLSLDEVGALSIPDSRRTEMRRLQEHKQSEKTSQCNMATPFITRTYPAPLPALIQPLRIKYSSNPAPHSSTPNEAVPLISRSSSKDDAFQLKKNSLKPSSLFPRKNLHADRPSDAKTESPGDHLSIPRRRVPLSRHIPTKAPALHNYRNYPLSDLLHFPTMPRRIGLFA